MRTLYHTWLCPFSRKIRLQLAEKKLDFALVFEKTWEKRPAFLEMNPGGQTPVLMDLDGTLVVESIPIGEYLEEAYPQQPLMSTISSERAEARRLICWFEDKFYHEVTHHLVFQKTLKRHFNMGGPESALIREGQARIHDHLAYISHLADHRKWLAGDSFTLADITAAAQLSTIDYLGDVPWAKHPIAKDWYARIKSRPTFRQILQDRFPALTPASHYHDLDF
jgi:glutathione S-transferase